ncbi:hypothetical protein [Vitiosangium sp. GDMCC 1.1324]|uniref:hypothetical protein n=1 Tax=Vitiosangium sp. (strain GDMCC 1.1324) TaxID=2138576 RepID=UPI0018EEAACA|nr:hypothetical protein [Vitiosangium sp. GDMCC 1.1324]
MTWKMLPLWMWLTLSLAACAQSSSSERATEDAPRGPPVIKSSLAVMLEHREELNLTAEQVAWMEKREQQLQEENAPLQKKLEQLRPQRGEGGRPSGGGHRGGMGGGMGGMGGGRMGGGGMGGSMGGGMMGGGRMGGGMGGPGGEGGPNREAMHERMAQARSTMREMQDNDTRAYNEAETQLTDAQKPRARELISQEREKLFRQHEAMRQQMGDGSR